VEKKKFNAKDNEKISHFCEIAVNWQHCPFSALLSSCAEYRFYQM